jgi:hypothetical protein
MKTTVTSFCAVVRIVSWGFVCGLLIAPVSSLVLRPLLVRLFRSRRRPQHPLAPAPLVRTLRTEHGLIVYATPPDAPGFPAREPLPVEKETQTLAERQLVLAH